MKRVLISKQDAVRLAGSEEYLRTLRRGTGFGGKELLCLFTGAKLFAIRSGAVIRYGIYGYYADGTDVDHVQRLLAFGIKFDRGQIVRNQFSLNDYRHEDEEFMAIWNRWMGPVPVYQSSP